MNSSTRRWLRARTFLVLISVLGAFVLAEAGLRLVGDRPALNSQWMLENEHRVLDDDLITVERRYLADSDYEPFQVKAPTKPIVALGDSFTFGIQDARVLAVAWHSVDVTPVAER